MNPTVNPAEVIAEDFSLYTHDPLQFAKYVFPWGEAGDLAESSGPRLWQGDVLQAIGAHLTSPATHYVPRGGELRQRHRQVGFSGHDH
jgi:hypothetical protein